MRILLIWSFVLLSCSKLSAANDEFSVRLRGLWADSLKTCDSVKTDGVARYDAKWLKVTATGVFGTTQGRFFRETSSPDLSVEIQALNEQGTIITLRLSVDDRLHMMISGKEQSSYQRC